MGGSKSQEFMVESDSGEDTCAISDESGYAANIEVATSMVPAVGRVDNEGSIEEFATPNSKTINDLIEHFGLDEYHCAKSVVYMIDSTPVLILMRGNDELNETKLSSVFKTNNFRPAEPEELKQFTGAYPGSIGPVGLRTNMKVVADNLLKDANGLVSGANKDGFHFKNIDFTRDCKIDEYHDFRTVKDGELCPSGTKMRIVKAIELGHIFKLGTKYSEALGATFLDAEGNENPIIMGSYGIGVERIMACYIEQNYDDKGIIWKYPLIPFHVHILGLNYLKSDQVKNTCDDLYKLLEEAGFDVLLDDRSDMAGVKFNDADLIGVPLQIIIGDKNLKDGKVEIKTRADGNRVMLEINEVNNYISGYYQNQ
jgi:prolyl-tRNA synthetase